MTRSGICNRLYVLISLVIVGGLVISPAGAANTLEVYPPSPDLLPSLPPPTWGACCWDDGTCTMTLPQDCVGYWAGLLTACAGQDCNGNGVDDFCDIASMYSTDCDYNGIPDECQPFEDCNANGLADYCDLAGCNGSPWCSDCNGNQVLDQCDIASGTSLDVLPPGGDGIPDECQSDCNGNGIPDDVDLASGTSQDCTGNGIPDECDIANGTNPDCNGNGVPDECDLATGTSQDCNANGTPDECDIAGGLSLDVLPPSGDGIPDECQSDCNGNGIPDDVDIASGTSGDCNRNAIPDECDIAAGTSPDANGDGIPDGCEQIKNVTQDTYFARIQWALDAAADGDEIVVAPGTYPEAINFVGKAVYLHSSDGAAVTTIDATGLNTSAVTCASGEGAGTVLEGFTITGGTGTRGGGMYNSGTSPTVISCTFSGNHAGKGAGMYNNGGNPTLTNCTFSGNETSNGGGMCNSSSSPTVTNCIFSGNWGWGGGMENREGSSPTVTNCTFSGNEGRGMANVEGSTPTVTDCTFSGNYGGMVNSDSSPTVTNCIFSGNVVGCGNGGGMCNWGGSPIVTNCTFSGNSTGCFYYGGGGIFNSEYGALTVTNCILWGNTPDEISGSALVAYSDVQGGYAGTGNIDVDPLFIDPGHWDNNGTPEPSDDFFVDGDYRLQPASPCIDGGDNTAVPAWLPTDLDGNPRFIDVPCRPDTGYGTPPMVDMGPYEAPETFIDCNGNGTDDLCDLLNGTSADCNVNGVPDECDIASGPSLDAFPPGGDGIPDECERVRNVTQQLYYDRIQPALDAALDGDVIVVTPGTYAEGINLLGKAVYLHSSDGAAVTTIDAMGLWASGVTCASGEGPDTILEGFTVTGGTGTPDQEYYGATDGGGMYNYGSSPTVINCTFSTNSAKWGVGGAMYNDTSNPTVTTCTFSANSASYGGGVYNVFSSPILTNCAFTENSTDYLNGSGGGMYSSSSDPTVTNCTFSGNWAGWYGGGMYNESSSPLLNNCAFSGNSASYYGCGIYNSSSSPTLTNCTLSGNWSGSGRAGMSNADGSNPTVSNCILWAGGISGDAATVTYSDVQGGYAGIGNLDADPLFVRPPRDGGDGWGDNPETPGVDEGANDDYGDLHLTAASPCIDAGENAAVPAWLLTDLDGNPRFVDVPCRPDTGNGTPPIVDMGSYEVAGTFIDCNGNATDDLCDVLNGTSADCNANGIPDECDIADGTSLDVFPPGGDGIPDECERVRNITQQLYYDRIQPALEAALDGDEIVVTPGTCNEAINFLGKAVYLHSSDGAAVTIIDARWLDTSVVTCSSGEGPGTVLEGFTITGGAGTPVGEGQRGGGGMYNENSSPTVTHCRFTGGTASWSGVDFGGGMYNEYSSPMVTDCMFGKNFAFYGAGMYNSNSSPMVSNCTFTENFPGGGMYNVSSNPAVTNCTFSWHYGWMGSGGGMINESSSPTVAGCAFILNGAYRGGGMDNNDSSPTVTNCTFSGNWADCGGGIYNQGGNPIVTNCVFAGNCPGSGIYNESSSPTITNCTFGGNGAGEGGGIYNHVSSPIVTNCILWSDTLPEIGGTAANVTYSSVQGGYSGKGNINAAPLFLGGPAGKWTAAAVYDPNTRLTTFTDTAAAFTPGALFGKFVDPGRDQGWPEVWVQVLIAANTTTTISVLADLSYWGLGNGTPYRIYDYHVVAGSPVIDAGDNTAVPAWLAADLDGKPRFWDEPDTPDTGNPDGIHPLVDMGPYEFGSEGCPDEDGDGFVTLCHIPPGHPERARTITVPVQAAPVHLAHGDYCGPCGGP